MQRGVIRFSKDQLSAIQQLVSDSDMTETLKAKLEPSADFSNVELSQEEVEQILDMLPPPSQSKQFESIRNTLMRMGHGLKYQ